jgi:hypothetical protein
VINPGKIELTSHVARKRTMWSLVGTTLCDFDTEIEEERPSIKTRVDKNYLFVKNILHISAYTTIIRHSFINVLRKKSLYNVKIFLQ